MGTEHHYAGLKPRVAAVATAIFQLTSMNASANMLAISILAQGLVIINLLFLVIDKRHRTLYDWLAGTSVVKRLPNGG